MTDTGCEEVGGTVVNIKGDHGNVPGPGWKHSLSRPSAKHRVTWFRALCHFILATPEGETQVSVPQRTDDRLRPRAGHLPRGRRARRQPRGSAVLPSEAAGRLCRLLLCVSFLSAAFEELDPRATSHRPEWALSSLRTPGWRVGHRRWQGDSRCGTVSVCLLVLKCFL